MLVGENNSGKTAIIDALRLVLFSSRDFDSLRLTEEDFRNGTSYAPIEVSCTFAGLTEEDEVHFQECLVDIGDGNFEMRSGENSEDRRLAYVAMTRARHLLVIGLPKTHFENHVETWKGWGFELAP